MANPVNWTALQQRVDFIVDGTWSEPVILIPWIAATGVYTSAEQGPDKSRKILVTTAIPDSPDGNVISEFGGKSTQVVQQDFWLSITMDKIGDVTDWVSGDRVYFPNRGRFYNISYISDSATLRPSIHLVREHDIVPGEGGPLLSQTVPTQANYLYFDTLGYRFYRSTAPTGPADSNGNATFTVNDWVAI